MTHYSSISFFLVVVEDPHRLVNHIPCLIQPAQFQDQFVFIFYPLAHPPNLLHDRFSFLFILLLLLTLLHDHFLWGAQPQFPHHIPKIQIFTLVIVHEMSTCLLHRLFVPETPLFRNRPYELWGADFSFVFVLLFLYNYFPLLLQHLPQNHREIQTLRIIYVMHSTPATTI